MRAVIIQIFIAPVILLNFGCAPGLGENMRVSRVNHEIVEPLMLQAARIPAVRVGIVTDLRESRDVATINNRKLPPSSNVVFEVRRAIERHLSLSGIRLTQFGESSMSVDLLKWHIDVRPGFPSTEVHSEAELVFRILNERGEETYNGRYNAFQQKRKPAFSQSEIEEILGEAMAFAIREALSDQGLLQSLQR
jgi:uncharacterized lipoprotein YajG